MDGDAIIQILTDLFNTWLHHQQVPKAWKNALGCIDKQERKYIRHKKLQTNQFASHYVPGVFKLFCTKDDSYAGFPPAM